ncbi:hypothetical protein ACFWPA_07345 [Rhodococcus sp. NPDC058505]|uniref:hypothetical protein n=1 Tax=unclassified Rhodococcus (in: high G+C Gram-positive bacteria) TaxID=192944 RepID=UPI003652DA29
MSNSILRRTAVAAAITATAACALPAVGTALPGSSDAKAGPFCASLSTENTPNGWGVPFEDEQGQKASYTADRILDEDGGLVFSVTDSSERRAWYSAAGTAPETVTLADIVDKEIGFAERADTSRASFQIRLLGTTGGKFDNGFTTLVWVAAGNDAADTADGARHTKLQDGLWWSTQNIDGAPGRKAVPLADIAKANPNATVEHYGVSIGTGSTNITTLVDEIVFNGCTTNFAKNDPEPGTGSDSGSDSGSGGGSSSGSLGNLFGSS